MLSVESIRCLHYLREFCTFFGSLAHFCPMYICIVPIDGRQLPGHIRREFGLCGIRNLFILDLNCDSVLIYGMALFGIDRQQGQKE